ncbi:MAG: YkvA family protein [Mesorhizobium sp.]|nr:YkvA family protein [Mesorhizobium sp.]MCO5163856.1 YkvA family protein [Mesorhizobium sp.]
METIKRWAKALKRDVVTLYLAGRDPRVPWLAKFISLAVAAYALSPIDLIPDFIPIIGYLDDLIIVPLGIALALRMIPPEVLADLRRQATQRISGQPRSFWGAAFVILVWIVIAAIAWLVLLE